MPIDRQLLSQKLIRYREQFQLTIYDLSAFTGISEERLVGFERNDIEPTGDEILILADFYKCDFKFFISSEKLAPFEQTEFLFRKYDTDFSKQDRWAIQEFLYLAECEEFLFEQLNVYKTNIFYFRKQGDYFKRHGMDAANSLRKALGYSDIKVPLNIYEDFRKIGLHVFRRKLENSNISGIYIKHPTAGKCILINYSEDIYRQRFTAAHEVGHAILDDETDVVVSFNKWSKGDLIEIRANTFASNYLMPPKFIKKLPNPKEWDVEKAIIWANKLKVSTEALANSLRVLGLIDANVENLIKSVRVPNEFKSDPELSNSLSSLGRERKKHLLERGLSTKFVRLCFEAYQRNIISSGRLAEMLLLKESELVEIVSLYGEEIRYGY